MKGRGFPAFSAASSRLRSTGISSASSSGAVLARQNTGRSGAISARRVLAASRCSGGIGCSNRNSPITCTFCAPNWRNRSAWRSDFAMIRSNARTTCALIFNPLVSRAKLLSGYCACACTSGRPLAWQVAIRRGQSSISMIMPKRGLYLAKNRRMAHAYSAGHQRTCNCPRSIASANSFSVSARPAAVMLVTSTGSPRSSSASINGRAARISPRETP